MSNEELKKQIDELTQTFITLKCIECAVNDPNLKELNFFTQLVDTGKGKYLLSFQYIEGEKILMREFKEC